MEILSKSKHAFSKLQHGNKNREAEDFSFKVGRAVRDLLVGFFKLSHKSAQLVLCSPEKLFHDHLLQELKKYAHREAVILAADKLIADSDNSDHTPAILNCAARAQLFAWLLEDIVKKDKLEGTLEELADFFKHICQFTPTNITSLEKMIEPATIKDWVKVQENQIKAKQDVSDSVWQKNESLAQQMAKDEKVEQEFGYLQGHSILKAKSSNQLYRHSNMLILHAVLTCKESNAQAKFIQMNYGNGKSWLSLWTGFMLKHFYKKEVIFAFLNQTLLDQTREKAEVLGLENSVFCLYSHLDRHNQRDVIVIADEYHWAITHEPFEIGANKKLPPVFLLGKQKANLIAYSGHKSVHFNDFIRENFPSQWTYEIGSLIKEGGNINSSINFDVNCFTTMQGAKD